MLLIGQSCENLNLLFNSCCVNLLRKALLVFCSLFTFDSFVNISINHLFTFVWENHLISVHFCKLSLSNLKLRLSVTLFCCFEYLSVNNYLFTSVFHFLSECVQLILFMECYISNVFVLV